MITSKEAGMGKYSTKYFGEFNTNITDTEIILDAKIKLHGEEKDVSIFLIDSHTYYDKMDECIKRLDEYPRLNRIGKREIIKDYRGNGSTREFFKKHFDKWEEAVNEQILGTGEGERIDLSGMIKKTNIKNYIESLEPPDILFTNHEGKIMVSLSYHIRDEGEEIIIVELDERLRKREIKWYIE
jgi:hypothetical protein